MKIFAVISQYLTGSGMGNQFIKSLIGSAGLRVVGMGFTFLIGMLLARGLGVEGYGVYGVAMSAISLLAMPAEFGFPPLLIREVAASQVTNNWSRMRGILYWTKKAALQISALTIASVLGWIAISGNELSQPIVSTLIAGVLMVPMGVLGRQKGAILLGLHHPIKGQIPDIIIRPLLFSLSLLVITVLSYQMSPAEAMFLGTVSAAFAYFTASLMLKTVMPPEIHDAVIILDERNWWKSAFPMAVTEGMRAIEGNIAILVLGALSTASTVGIFRVASSVSMIITMPITLFLIVGSPLISRLYAQGDYLRLQRLLSWVSVGMVLGSICLTLPFLIAGKPLLAYVFGQEFGPANTPLLIFCFGSILFSSFGASVVLLNMCGHEKRVTFSFATSLIALLVLIIPLTRIFKENGAALAGSISMVLGNIMMWNYARTLLKLDTSIYSLIKR